MVRVEGEEDRQVSNTSLYVRGLERGRPYFFSVSAYNNGGEGPSSTVPYRVPPGESEEGVYSLCLQGVVGVF